MADLNFVQIGLGNMQLVQSFLESCGTSLKTFRYFATRPLSVIKRHVCTWVIETSGCIEAYGHLDPEDNQVWLGVAVTERYQGRGLGRQMMQRLMESAHINQIYEIRLSVDSTNAKAIKLYEDFGFQLLSQTVCVRYYEWKAHTTVASFRETI